MLTSGASAGTLFFYGESLPTLQSFKHRFQFQNTVIRASNGKVLYDMADLSKTRGRRVVEPLQYPGSTTAGFKQQGSDWLVGIGDHGIPLTFQDATIATEDSTFYSNPGFDPLSIVRAAYDNYVRGTVVSGASTITQQLVRKYMLGDQQTLSRKAEEVILATEMTQKYPKSKILWYYLNSVPYGNLSIGAQAAAQTYFHKNVWQLDPAESAFLAGLPEAPSLYDPVNDKPEALKRMRYVLHLMYNHGYLQDSQGNPNPLLIDQYVTEISKVKFTLPQTLKLYPHFVEYAVNQLQQIKAFAGGKIYNGLDVTTTLDPGLQDKAQKTVQDQISQLGSYNVTDGALVSVDLRPQCYGCIRAMVGSADYRNAAIAGQINMADRPRQPGSSFKPFSYVYAFEHGLGPGSTVLDAPLAIPDPGNPLDGGWYEPTDYDHTWHGVVTLRTALQNSLNIPALKVEQYNASIASNGLKAIEDQAVLQGLTSFPADNPNCCGWSLTLGGLLHGTRLVEETSAYGAFATGGMTVPPIAIKQVRDRSTGKVLWDLQKDGPKPVRAMSAAAAYVINNVLSDNSSRCLPQVCEFGIDSPLNLGRTVAAKTGTTNDFTDNWTVGYTPDIVSGVWVGNANNSQMVGSTGITGAAPIWHDFMLAAFDYLHLPPKDFREPDGVYLGSSCRITSPGGYTSPGTTVSDIYAILVPICSVGTNSTYLPIPQAGSQYAATATSVPAAAPTASTAALPTAVPPTISSQVVPGSQPGNQSPPVLPVQPTAAPLATQAPPPTAVAPAPAPTLAPPVQPLPVTTPPP
jgi:membrane peptidoglycan carboxypeptidase